MAYEKKEPQKTVEDPSLKLKELEAKIKELEAAKDRAEEEAVEKVCAALGTTPKALETEEKRRKDTKVIMEYDIGPIVVTINGNIYTGRGQATAEIVEMVMHMAGAKRMREIRARIGNNYEINMLTGGAMSSRVVGKAEESLI